MNLTLNLSASATGFEPATYGVTGRYSNQLNYAEIILLIFSITQVEPRGGN